MAETTKQVKDTASPTGAISFLVFDEQKYRASNPDVEKAVQHGQHRSPYEHWRSLGRVEHLAGKRRAGCPAYEVHFHEATFLRAFPDVAQALGAKAPQAAFGYWMRHGLLETLADKRPDVCDVRRRGTECLLRTLAQAREHLTVFAVPIGAAAEQFEIVARGADGAWLSLEEVEVTNVRSAQEGSGGTQRWIVGAFASKAAPAQVFVASRSSQNTWSEHLITPVPGVTTEPAPGPGGAALFEALRDSASARKHLKAFLECLVPKDVRFATAQRVHVETIEVLSSAYLRCSGWLVDRLEPWTGIYVSLGDSVVQIEPSGCLRCRRADLAAIPGMTEQEVYEAGFFFLGSLPHTSPAVASAIVIAISANHFLWQEVGIGHVNDSPDALIRGCIDRMQPERTGPIVPFLRAGAGQVFASLIERHEKGSVKASEVVFGSPPAKPEVSIIVPLYDRVDFLKHQLAHFSRDPALQSAEIIYVLDDPKRRERTLRLAEMSWGLFGLPFKVMLLSANRGYGCANNAGAQRATAPHLVFLNSDVVPKDPGWIKQLTAPLVDAGVGIVGARLLHHDGTLQHDGVTYERRELQSTFGGLVECIHPGKGVVPEPLHGQQEEAVAVTGACLAMRRADFEKAGGFSEGYFVGGYEDSDLCLRIRQLGKRIVVNRACVLFHLEKQSVARGVRATAITVVNAYIHEQKWGTVLTKLAGNREAA